MTTIKIQGGLGNQMFQYAYGRKLEISGRKIVFNVSFFKGQKANIDTARNFKLNNFNIETKAQFSDKQDKFQVFCNKVKRRFSFKIEEYFQSEKYFKDIEELIRKEFTLKDPLSIESSEWKNKIENIPTPVSLHIRRGDYVKEPKTNAYHGVCGLDYYKKAYETLATKINTSLEIFVFSDNIEWTKNNLRLPCLLHFVSAENIHDYEEIILMSKCNHHIIANSSFSWWGAWLNPSKEKIVIAPEKWFANPKEDSKDIVPKDWIKI